MTKTTSPVKGEKLLDLGCKEEVVEGRWQILVASKTLDDLAQQIKENHLACDIEQFLFPIFRARVPRWQKPSPADPRRSRGQPHQSWHRTSRL